MANLEASENLDSGRHPTRVETPLELEFRDLREVIVTPEIREAFLARAQEAALACQSEEPFEIFERELKKLLGQVNSWCDERADTIQKAAFLALDGEPRIILVTKGSEFRLELGREVAELDLLLSREYPGCPLDVFQIPERSHQTEEAFIQRGAFLIYHGDRTRASGAGAS